MSNSIGMKNVEYSIMEVISAGSIAQVFKTYHLTFHRFKNLRIMFYLSVQPHRPFGPPDYQTTRLQD
jgi:hypothetical protein